jgi:hypothetical protein
MSFDKSLRARVQRMLRGSYIESDFNELFLALRQRPYGQKLVTEIGNFVAHRETREQGVATDIISGFVAEMRFHFPQMGGRPPHSADALPADTLDVFRFKFSRMTDQEVSVTCHCKNRKQGKAIFDSVMQKIVPNGAGGLRLATQRFPTPEYRLLKRLLEVMTVKPAFTGKDLFVQFREALRKNKLLGDAEIAACASIEAPLALFTVGRLHHSSTRLPDGTTAPLVAACDDRTISVMGTGVVGQKDGRVKSIAFDVFATNLDPATHCEGDLVRGRAAHEAWDGPLELSPAGKLRVITNTSP